MPIRCGLSPWFLERKGAEATGVRPLLPKWEAATAGNGVTGNLEAVFIKPFELGDHRSGEAFEDYVFPVTGVFRHGSVSKSLESRVADVSEVRPLPS